MEGLPAGVEVLEASGEVGPSFGDLVKTPTVDFRKVQVTEATVDLGGAGGITLTAGAYNVPTLPGPPQVFVETHFDAISIDDLELSTDDESTLESRLGVTDSPGDIVWNTVGFQIPWGEMDAAMRDAPGGDREHARSLVFRSDRCLGHRGRTSATHRWGVGTGRRPANDASTMVTS